MKGLGDLFPGQVEIPQEGMALHGRIRLPGGEFPDDLAHMGLEDTDAVFLQ